MRTRLSSVLVCLAGVALLFTNSGSSASDKGNTDKQAEENKEVAARLRADQLAKALAIYAVDRDGVYPASLEDLLQKDKDGGPYLADRKDLLDPWGKKYQFDPKGPKNLGAKPDVWTVTPGGKTIGNWMALKEKKPGDKPQTGTVSGKVTFNGEPLRGGSIYFTGEKSKASAKIDPDGTYIARKLPVGPLKVRILSKTVAIPKKYTSFKTSGLIVRIKQGDQEINIELQ